MIILKKCSRINVIMRKRLYSRPLAKKIYAIIESFQFNPLELTHNYKLLITNYNALHNGGD
ncbi:hypothetical protein QUB43_24755, partial [Microcoleus sp. A6-D4]